MTEPPRPHHSHDRRLWLAVGVAFGFVLGGWMPGEPAYAQTAVAGEKFSIVATRTATSTADAVFVLDNLTGRVVGAHYNSSVGKFTGFYQRNVVEDFDLGGNDPQFIMISADVYPSRLRGGGPVGVGGVYIGELTSGAVNLYGVNLIATQRAVGTPQVYPLTPIDKFEFRQAAAL